MRVKDVFTEATRQLTPRVLLASGIAGLILLGITTLTAIQALAALKQEHDARRAGKYVYQISSESSPLSASACESLNSVSGVWAAGGELAEAPTRLMLTPQGRPLPAAFLTPGAARVWGLSESESYVGRELERRRIAAPGQELFRDEGARLRISASLPPDGVPGPLQSAVVEFRPAWGMVSVCWLRMAPGNQEAAAELARFVFDTPNLKVQPLHSDPAAAATPHEQWLRYLGMRPAWFAGLTIGALVGLIAFADRPQWAIYRTFGASRWEVSAILLAQYVVAGFPVLLAAALLGPTLAGTIVGVPVPVAVSLVSWGQALAAWCVGLASGWLGGVLATAGNPQYQLKDR